MQIGHGKSDETHQSLLAQVCCSDAETHVQAAARICLRRFCAARDAQT